jgi:hypothetical protein
MSVQCSFVSNKSPANFYIRSRDLFFQFCEVEKLANFSILSKVKLKKENCSKVSPFFFLDQVTKIYPAWENYKTESKILELA